MGVAALTAHDRTATAILDAATHLLAERGSSASMSDVARTAGVGRATLYRYFESREALLAALSHRAVADAAAQIGAAGLEQVPFDEAIARIARALVSVGDRYAILVREQVPGDDGAVERHVREPIRATFARGRQQGALRRDVPTESLIELFRGCLEAAIRMAEVRGVEDSAAAVTALFLDGARERTDERA